MTTPASLQVPLPWQGPTITPTSKHSYFTKSSQEQWLFQSSVGTPLTYRSRRYPSASAALDDYIRKYDQKPEGYQQKYDDDLMSLLTNPGLQNVSGSSGREQSNAQKLADIKKLVEDSYSRLDETSTVLDDSARVLRAVERDPLPSPSDLAVPARRSDSQSTVTTDQLLMANPLGLTHGVTPRETRKVTGSSPLSTSQLRNIRSHIANNYGLNLHVDDRQSRSLDSLLSDTGNQRENFTSMSSSGPSAIQPGSFGAYQGSLGAPQRSSGAPDWVNDLEGSDTSSIVTGHFQNGLVGKPPMGTIPKMASTPKHAAAKPKPTPTARLQLDDLRQFRLSQMHPSKMASQVGHPSANFNPNAKSCLKPVPTDIALRPVNSKVSFADDTNLSSRATFTPTSRSRSRSFGNEDKIGNQPTVTVSVPQSRMPVTGSTNAQGFQGIQNPEHRKFLQKLMTEIEKSSGSLVSDLSPPEQAGSVRQPQQATALPRELFVGSGGGRQADSISDVPLSQTVEWGSDRSSLVNHQGAGYLARIQQLLRSPVLSETQEMAAPPSPTTDTVLDGDRPWEQHPTIKPPVYLGEEMPSPGMINQYKQHQMMRDTPASLEQTLTGGAQPGSLEALKQMLFTMQNIADEEKAEDDVAETTQQQAADMVVDELGEMSPSTRRLLADTKQPGGESLDRAMQHLRKLKFLVESEQKSITSPK